MTMRFIAPILALTIPLAPAFGQDAATVATAESEQHGQYLVNSEGETLYLFTADTQGQGDTQATVSCTAECLAAWPLLKTTGEPQAGEGADASLLGTTEHLGDMVVTYNGWPLYTFVRDEQPGQTNGQEIESFGGEWYLVSPAGEKIEGK